MGHFWRENGRGRGIQPISIGKMNLEIMVWRLIQPSGPTFWDVYHATDPLTPVWRHAKIVNKGAKNKDAKNQFKP